MCNLFDSIERTYLEAAKHNENTYDYYNISARTDITKVRDALEGWFSRYPKEEKKELKSRFKKDFDSKVNEMMQEHELHQKQVQALRLLEQKEDQLHRNILLINEMRKAILNSYCKK